MNWRLPLTLALLLGAIATGWSVWRMSHPADDGVLRTRPDYVLRDYEITALDKQGKESFTLRGPMLQRDHGDIEVVEIDGKNIYVNLKGACQGCMMEQATLSGIQAQLVEALGEFVQLLPAGLLGMPTRR